MRKLLLATTALVGVAVAATGAQAAASSPISLNVGGYNDFVAGIYHESGAATGISSQGNHDFEDEFKINFDAMGKAMNGIEYGANVSLWNGEEANTGWARVQNGLTMNSAYVWLSGAWGKVLTGDEHSASSDLFVYAPTVGEGQVDGRYFDFVNPVKLDRFYASGIDNTEHSTKITYFTPKVGNENNKVQLGVSYTPNMYDYGQGVAFTNGAGNQTTSTSPYQDVIDAAVEYMGNFRPVNVAASAKITTGDSSSEVGHSTTLLATAPTGLKAQDFTSFGLGGQVGYQGFTAGVSYDDLGRYNTVQGQNKNQDVWTFGGKYEFDKVAVGVSYLTGEEYDNMLTGGSTVNTTSTNYVSSFDALGAGASYTWFPGLTSNIDGVMFWQGVSNQTNNNDGFVLLVSQKMTF